jgi:hypothetical protein
MPLLTNVLSLQWCSATSFASPYLLTHELESAPQYYSFLPLVCSIPLHCKFTPPCILFCLMFHISLDRFAQECLLSSNQLSCQKSVLLPLPTVKLIERTKTPFNFDKFLQNINVVLSSHGRYAIPAPGVASFHQLSIVSHDRIH